MISIHYDTLFGWNPKHGDIMQAGNPFSVPWPGVLVRGRGWDVRSVGSRATRIHSARNTPRSEGISLTQGPIDMATKSLARILPSLNIGINSSYWLQALQPRDDTDQNALEYEWISSPCIHDEVLQCDVLTSTFLDRYAHSIPYINEEIKCS